MNKELEIQRCAAADSNEISRVAIQAYNEFYLYLWKDDGSWYIKRSFLPEVIREEIEDPNARVYLLKYDGAAIGFMKVNLDKALEEFGIRNGMELERIYIRKAFGGKGFGRKAIQFCEDLARGRSKEVLWLKSMDSSPAIVFYQRFGFEICGSFTLHYKMMKPEFRGMKVLMKKL